MSRFVFELAEPSDDAALRRVIAETPMQGDISISFRREPSYFDAAVVGGPLVQTGVARDTTTGDVVGFGVRSVREMYINGHPSPIGYLSSLRLIERFRSRGLVARGYRFFRDLHADGRTPLYLTTIAEGNDKALSILTSGRGGLPPYHYAGRYLTMALPALARGHDENACVRPMRENELHDVLAFLNLYGPRRQFFPRYEARDFFTSRCSFRDLQPVDILLAIREGRIVGALGVWNQTGFRQSVVRHYSRRLNIVRPFYNAWARLSGRPGLPPVGRPLNFAVAAALVVAEDDPLVLRALLTAARRRASLQQASHLLVGMLENDPLAAMVGKVAAATYVTRLYLVSFADGDDLRLSLDGRPPYLELGTL